jgi:hypothetical protein
MRRLVCFLFTGPGLLIGLVVASPTLAADPRSPVPLPDPNPIVLPAAQYCGDFTVNVTVTDFNQYIVRSTTAPNGTVTMRITGRARAIVTNVATGASVSYNISGPGTLVFNSDGSFSGDVAGPNLLWTTLANSFPGVPTISYTTGHVTFAVAPSGLTTSYSLAGARTDVCAVLRS